MNIGIIIAIAVLGLWALSVFVGAIGGFTKAFTHTPTAVDSSVTKDQAQNSIEDTQEKQKQEEQDMKDKMEDMQRP